MSLHFHLGWQEEKANTTTNNNKNQKEELILRGHWNDVDLNWGMPKYNRIEKYMKYPGKCNQILEGGKKLIKEKNKYFKFIWLKEIMIVLF